MDLYVILAIAAAFIGLAVTGTAVYTVWYLHREMKKRGVKTEFVEGIGGLPDPNETSEGSRAFLLKWSVFDYAVVLLFVMGMLFLLADLVGMIREHLSYPLFHYGYLLCGFIFSLIGMIFMIIRLAVVLRIANSRGLSSPHHHKEPEHTYYSE